MNKPDRHLTTRAPSCVNPVNGAIVPALHASDAYEWEDSATKPTFDYSRSNNPNRSDLIAALCALEGAIGGAITSSGQSAALLALFLVPQGARIVAPHDCYGGTFRLLEGLTQRGHLDAQFVDQHDPAAIAASLQGGAALLWIETPSNPLLRCVDVAMLAEMGHEAGALVLADNTVATPCRQQPLALGCDLVLHSTTKAINGHQDLFGGALLAKDGQVAETIDWWCNAAGLAASAFDCWQTLRGLRTLELRLAQQERNAIRIANFLCRQKQVRKVYYPGLTDHPDRALVAHQMTGPGTLLSFELGDDAPPVETFLSRLNHFILAPSLGGMTSLICRPSTMTHRGMPDAAQREAGIPPELLRLSVGIEPAELLVDDLHQALVGVQS